MQLEGRVFVGRVEGRLHLEVTNMQRRAGHERDIAEDAAHAPEVLILDIAAVAPAVDLDRDHVLAGRQILRDIELGRHARVLAVSDLLAIDPHVECRVDAVEQKIDLAAAPLSGNGELAAVGADRVALIVRRPGVIVGSIGDAREIALERIRDVGVDGGAVALHLPVRGDGNFLPRTHVEIWLVKIYRAKLRALDPVEFPRAVERLQWKKRGPQRAPPFIGKRSERGAPWLLVDSEHVRVFPVTRGRIIRLGNQDRAHKRQTEQQRANSLHFRFTSQRWINSTRILLCCALGQNRKHGVPGISQNGISSSEISADWAKSS